MQGEKSVTFIPADGIYFGRHYIPDHQGAKSTLLPEAAHLGLLLSKQLEITEANLYDTKSSVLTQPFLPPIIQDRPEHIHITAFTRT